MPRTHIFKDALFDLGDDIAWRAGSLLHRVFDGLCLLALGTLVYVTSIDSAEAGLHSRALFGVQAKAVAVGVALNASQAPSSCQLTNDLLPTDHSSCIQAMILEPAAI